MQDEALRREDEKNISIYLDGMQPIDDLTVEETRDRIMALDTPWLNREIRVEAMNRLLLILKGSKDVVVRTKETPLKKARSSSPGAASSSSVISRGVQDTRELENLKTTNRQLACLCAWLPHKNIHGKPYSDIGEKYEWKAIQDRYPEGNFHPPNLFKQPRPSSDCNGERILVDRFV